MQTPTTNHQTPEDYEKILRAIPLDIKMSWLPKSAPFVGFKRARQLAFGATRTAVPIAADGLHTIKGQKQKPVSAAGIACAER
jgi:hypothetical protein